MMVEIGWGWALDVEYGPDWLFVRPRGPATFDAQQVDLAEQIWLLLEKQFARRLVLEMDEIGLLRSELIGQLVRLHTRVTSQGGLMRLTGLSEQSYEALRAGRLGDRFPYYATRHDAVMGYRPHKPK